MKSFTVSVGHIVALAVVVSLTGCGGGGGGAAAVAVPPGSVTSTLSFPLQSADRALAISGFSKTFTVSGSCNGTGTDSTTPATTAATFETMPALSSINTLNMTLTGAACLPSISQITTFYYNSSYISLGSNSTGQYGVFLTPPAIPASVQVGASGIYGTETYYTDRTKVTLSGKADMSYVIEPDTANTAIANMTTKLYDAAGVLLQTQQNRARITAAGVLTPISIDIVYTTVPSTHLVVTYN